MSYFLARSTVLKWLETPSVYHIRKDELYELDDEGFKFLNDCQKENGADSSDNKFTDFCLEEGILTEEKINITRPQLIKSSSPSLRYLELQITDRCNLKCGHCYLGGRTANQRLNELSQPQIEKVLKDLEEMQGLRVLITGGEPLLHGKFDEINEMLPEFFLRKILFTNGLLLSKQILKNLNVDEIQISIDGLKTAHDSLRGKGAFEKTMNAMKSAIASGFEVSISTMVHRKNLNDFDEMNRLFRSIGIKEWTVDVPSIAGSLTSHPEFQVTPAEGGRFLKYGFGEGLHSGTTGFGCGLHLMAVMADGKAAKCTFYADKSAGNIEEGLRKCWEGIKPIRLSELKCDCEYLEYCRGGCRYRAELLGDPCGKDLYKCFLYDIIES